MPQDFRCTNCELRFSVGWFHYHCFSSGYGAQTLLVCTCCGLQHALEIATHDRGPEFYEKFDVELTSTSKSDRFEALRLIRRHLQCTNLEAGKLVDNLPLPLAVDLWSHECDVIRKSVGSTGISLTFTVAERIPNDGFGPLMQDRMLAAAQTQRTDERRPMEEISVTAPLLEDGAIDLEKQACSGCSQVGTLAHRFELPAVCPSCRLATIEDTGFWIT